MRIQFPPSPGPGPGQIPEEEPSLNIPGVGSFTGSQKQTIENLINMTQGGKDNADWMEEQFAHGGKFAEFLQGVGITDQDEIDGVLSYVKEEAGYEPPKPAGPSADEIASLFTLAQAMPYIAKQFPQPAGGGDITNLFKKYPGLEGNVQNFITMAKADISNKANQATIDQRFAYFTQVLNSLGVKDPNDIAAIISYIKAQAGGQTPVTPPSPPVTPPGQPVTLPTDLTPAQQNMVNNILIEMASYKKNYLANLAQLEKLGATPAAIYAFKQKAQQAIDALFTAGPPPGDITKSLLSVGLKDPDLTQVINYLKQAGGFYPPVDDLGQNFNDQITSWENAPGRTAGEKDFAEALKALIKPGMTADQIQTAINTFLAGKGDKDIFVQYGIDPKNFQDLAAMLPTVHVTFPIPTDIENAYVQSYKLDTPTGNTIRDALAKFPNDFAGFKAYVQNILPSAPKQDQALIAELSGNQPVNKPPPPSTTPDGSALFTYVNTSGVPDSQVYIQVIGKDPHTGRQCFIQYDRNGTPHYIDAQPGMNSKDYAFPLSYFNRSADGTGANFYLPALDGGRIYTSIGEPLTLNVDPGGGIINPNPHELDDPNNAVRWDKTEFTTQPYQDAAHQGMIFLNATAVDNVTLPLLVSVTRDDGSVFQGGLTQGVYDQLKQELESKGPPWSGLVQGNTILSVMDAASTGNFPQDFFTTPPGKSWMDGFISKYGNTPLQISTNDSITPGDDGKGVWSGKIDPNTHQMVFTRSPPGQPSPPAVNQVAITIPSKTSELLSGTGDGWKMGSVQQMTNELYSLGLTGSTTPALSDTQIQAIINGLPNSNPNKAKLQNDYNTMKIQINLARDISVATCTNTLGAKSEQVMADRLGQLAQDGQIPKVGYLENLTQGKDGNWVPALTMAQISTYINSLPPDNPLKQHLKDLLGLMQSGKDAPLCQDTFTATYQTAYSKNPNMPDYAQFEDPVAAMVAANAVKAPGHQDDRYGNIYTSPYTDSTGHEGGASSIPSQFQSGYIDLGNFGTPNTWTS